MDSPTMGRAGCGPATQVSGFVEACYALDVGRLRSEFNERHRSAPRRSSYIADRAITRRKANSNRAEELLAHDLFTRGVQFALPDGIVVDLADFQTPLNARRSDGLGKVDLLGCGRSLWVIELKVLRRDGSADTPLAAVLEATEYCAVVQANLTTLRAEVAEAGHAIDDDEVAALVLAPFDYWQRWDRPPAAMGWREGLRHAADVIAEATGVQVRFGAFEATGSELIAVTSPLETALPQLARSRRSVWRPPAQQLEAAQRDWAERHHIPMLDRKHTETVDLNLFMPLSPATRADIEAGGGAELDSSTAPPRLSNLRSSTALAVNVFDPWTGCDLAALTEALNVGTNSGLRFEQKYPSGLGGQPPNLDVVLHGDRRGSGPVAIEAKFIEPYDGQDNRFRPSYFTNDAIWQGLPTLRRVAESADTWGFERLKAAQLIKHALGLARAYAPDGFTLMYLWYDHPSEAADVHRAEIEQFAAHATRDIDFRSVTYQELISRLATEPVSGYFVYLADRYRLQRPSLGEA